MWWVLVTHCQGHWSPKKSVRLFFFLCELKERFDFVFSDAEGGPWQGASWGNDRHHEEWRTSRGERAARSWQVQDSQTDPTGQHQASCGRVWVHVRRSAARPEQHTRLAAVDCLVPVGVGGLYPSLAGVDMRLVQKQLWAASASVPCRRAWGDDTHLRPLWELCQSLRCLRRGAAQHVHGNTRAAGGQLTASSSSPVGPSLRPNSISIYISPVS